MPLAILENIDRFWLSLVMNYSSYFQNISKWLFCFVLFLSLISKTEAQDLSDIKNTKAATLSGSLGTNMVFYNANGIKDRQDPFAYGFNANATLTLYGISMPFSFTWYNHNSTYSQPFNQFGVSPKYKWITAHLGYRNLTFSEFTLNGHTFLGAGVELNPGKFRFGALYGKFNENSEYDPYMADSLPKFTRKGWAMKIGYGDDKSFVDFSMLRIGDDPENFQLPKTSDSPLPQQNMAYGLTGRLAVTKQLIFDVDGSLSFYTENRKANRIASIDDKWLSFSDNFMTINQTSKYYTAFKSALVYKFTDKITTGFEYRRIGPEYRSMGAYFFNNDVENITINQTGSFLKNKLTARGSLGMQHDNLDNTKKTTSKRTIGSLVTTYTFNENYAIDATYSNFTTNQKAGKMAVIDSLKLYQVNHNVSIIPRYMKVTEKMSHVVMFNINLMKLDDKNKKTQNQTETNTTILTGTYVLGLLQQKLNLTFCLNHTKLKNNVYSNNMDGLTAGLSKTMMKDRLSFSWINSYMINKINSDKGTVINSVLSSSYKLDKHMVSFNINYIDNSFKKNSTTPSFNEIRGDFSYVFTF
jgi:hypothetical protein